MAQGQINKTRRVILPVVVVLLIIAVIEAWVTLNEPGLSHFILSKLLIPIIVCSVVMSAYWTLLTEDFWDLYERRRTGLWTFIKTAFKFFIWIPGMGLYFFAVTQGILSIYNRTAGDQKTTLINGQITGMDQYSSSGTTRYYFEIDDTSLQRKVKIRVDEFDFNKFSAGDKYQAERKLGALRFFYESRY